MKKEIYFKNQEEHHKYIIGNNLIMKCYVGSKMYGTATPSSDEDIFGIFLPTRQTVYGLDTINEISYNTNPGNTQNTKDDKDISYDNIVKFIKTLKKNGPAEIETLFQPEENIIYCNNYWDEIVSNRELFISKLLFKSMFGYAYSQKEVARRKRDRFFELSSGINYLESLLEQGFKKLNTDQIKGLFDVIGRYANKAGRLREYQINQPIDQVLSSYKKEFARYGHRSLRAFSKKEKEYQYDYKFVSHAIRLVLECIEIAETGKITFPLKDKELITDIKLGKYTLGETEEMFTELDDKFNRTKEKSQLPETPNYHKINKLLISLLERKFVPDEK